MKRIYLDHNVARYFVRGFPPNIDGPNEHQSLQKCLSGSTSVRFVLTDWNIVETARECARAPDPLDEARRYADFFESLRPLFIEGHSALEATEMKSYAYARWGMKTKANTPDWMFATEFSQIASGRVPEILVGFDLRIYLHHLTKTESSRAEIHRSVGVAQSAQQTGIDAYKDGRQSDRELKRQINREWFFQLIPERDPDNRWIARERREELAGTLSSCPDEVFRHCPAIFAESVMTDVRAMAGGRKAKPQDLFDLMHIVPALAYCDAFVSNDGLLRKQSKEASGRMGRNVVIAAILTDATEGLL
jgi:hypothetical protein